MGGGCCKLRGCFGRWFFFIFLDMAKNIPPMVIINKIAKPVIMYKLRDSMV
jgi:hypothetical protein